MGIDKDILEKFEYLIRPEKESMLSTLGIEFVSVSAQELVARMPVDYRTHQPLGLLHGGANVVLAETLASTGGWLHIDTERQIVVGAEINANHLRPVTDGFVTGTATPIHIGSKTHVWDIRIRDENGKLTCISRCTLSVLERKASQ